MKFIYNHFIPFKGFSALNFLGIIFIRKGIRLTDMEICHERIHSAQQKELWYLFFFLWYFLEWLIKLVKYGKNSYYHISFEREAYANEDKLYYLHGRKRFAFLRYL